MYCTVHNFPPRAGNLRVLSHPPFYTTQQLDNKQRRGVFFVPFFFFLQHLYVKVNMARRSQAVVAQGLIRHQHQRVHGTRDLVLGTVPIRMHRTAEQEKQSAPSIRIVAPIVWRSHSCNVVRKNKSQRAQKNRSSRAVWVGLITGNAYDV